MNMSDDIQYDLAAIERNIQRHDDNIKMFEEAIEKEIAQQNELKRIARELRRQQSNDRQN